MTRLLLSILLCAGFLAGPTLADSPVRFEHLTINEGLPENSVRSILQDQHGFLWFGTQNGVARFDGTAMDVHLPDPDDPGSIDTRRGGHPAGVGRCLDHLESQRFIPRRRPTIREDPRAPPATCPRLRTDRPGRDR